MKVSIHNQVCPHADCPFHGQDEQGNVTVHSQRERRLRCTACGGTWVEHRDSLQYGLRKNLSVIQRALELLEQGVPIRRVAQQLKVNPGTVQRWKKRKQKIDRSPYLSNFNSHENS